MPSTESTSLETEIPRTGASEEYLAQGTYEASKVILASALEAPGSLAQMHYSSVAMATMSDSSK